MIKRVALASVLAGALALPAQAATWEVDAAHSNLGFIVKHLVIAKVRGNFKTFSGTVTIDDKDITKSKVDVKIDPASIDTDNAKRDEHLKSADFFDTAKHKEITFKSTKIEKAGEGKLKVTGDFAMHGVTKPLTLDCEGPSAEMKDPGGRPHVAFSCTGNLKRADWGLTWNKAIEGGNVVGDEVKLELDIELFNKK